MSTYCFLNIFCMIQSFLTQAVIKRCHRQTLGGCHGRTLMAVTDGHFLMLFKVHHINSDVIIMGLSSFLVIF